MAAKTVAFRINPKNREDQEIMDWLDEVVIQQQIYESYTEALKWAVLSFLRGEAIQCLPPRGYLPCLPV